MTLTADTTTLKVYPSGITPTYNETILVLESANIICDNFKWLVDIYIDNYSGGTELISSLQILPNPDGYGILDVHRHIENHITSTFYPADLSVGNLAIDSYTKWHIDVTETFTNPRWRFDDNFYATGYTNTLGFTTDGYTNVPHIFATGDTVIVQQDAGATNPQYDGPTTIIGIVDEYTVMVDKPFSAVTSPEGGIIYMTGNTSRDIYQESIGLSGFTSFNGVMNYDTFFDFDSSDYDMSAASPGSFLTNLPSTYTCDIDSHVWVQAYASTGTLQGVRITTDNGTFWYQAPISAGINGNVIKQFKIGPVDILTDDTTTPYVISGSLPAIDDNTTFIDYEIVQGNPGSGFVSVSDVNTLNLETRCSKYEKYQLFFLDRYGSYIPIWFNLVSKKKINNTKSNYSKNYGTYDAVSNVWGYTTYDRGIKTYDIVTNESITVTSDWLSEADNELVQIMLTSPEVYHIDESGVFRAINITTTSYDVKKQINDKLVNYVISFEYAIKNRNQRG